MDLLDQRVFTFNRVRNLLADGAILDRPVEDTVLGGVMILPQIDEFKLVFETFYLDGPRRLRPLQVHLIDRSVQTLSVLAIVFHASFLKLLYSFNFLTCRVQSSLALLVFIFGFIKPFDT